MSVRQSGRASSGWKSKGAARHDRALEKKSTALICKQISNQDVGFDSPAAILMVEGRGVPFLVFPQARYNQRWEDLEKLTIPLAKLLEHYAIDLRSQNRSDKTPIFVRQLCRIVILVPSLQNCIKK
jgi:hypothetical protein